MPDPAPAIRIETDSLGPIGDVTAEQYDRWVRPEDMV